MNNETNQNNLFQPNGGKENANSTSIAPNVQNGQYSSYPQEQNIQQVGYGIPSVYQQGVASSFNNNENMQQPIQGQGWIPQQESMPMRVSVPIVENSEQESPKTSIPTESFTEMPFVGVNQQELEERKTTILPNNINPEKIDQPSFTPNNSNMRPVEKKADENAGIKFLFIIFILLLVVILCLPLIGLN